MAQALLLVIRDEDAEASDAHPTDVVGPQVSGAMSQERVEVNLPIARR
jgi:hypothetical protein